MSSLLSRVLVSKMVRQGFDGRLYNWPSRPNQVAIGQCFQSGDESCYTETLLYLIESLLTPGLDTFNLFIVLSRRTFIYKGIRDAGSTADFRILFENL